MPPYKRYICLFSCSIKSVRVSGLGMDYRSSSPGYFGVKYIDHFIIFLF